MLNTFSAEHRKESEAAMKIKNKTASVRGGVTEWDIVVLTASNESQAERYRKQISFRRDAGLLSKNIRFEVVPDYKNRRIGSGGATFNVLRYICENSDEKDYIFDKRILVIHSGGESIRIPQYSACGKLFAPVQRELGKGVTATLFDEILDSVKALPANSSAGMLTLAGDILLVFNPLEVDLKDCDAAAISACANIETGENHGVFIPNKEGNVKKFLHKWTAEDLKKSGAQEKDGNVHIDTGAIWFSDKIINTLVNIIGSGKKIDSDKFEAFTNERLSFYADLVYPFASDATFEQYLKEKPEGDYTKQLSVCREILFQALHGYKMKLIELSKADFVHFGTTSELLELVTVGIKKYPSLGWKRAVNSTAKAFDCFTANGSTINETSVVGEGSYVENSHLHNSTVGKGCVVSNIILESATIPDNMVVHCLKQNDGDYVVRVYGVADNPKKSMHEGGTIFGIPLYEYIKKNRMSKDDVWGKEPYDLWNAKLFLKSRSSDESLKYALSLNGAPIQDFQAQKKTSLKQSSEKADFSNLLLIKKHD